MKKSQYDQEDIRKYKIVHKIYYLFMKCKNKCPIKFNLRSARIFRNLNI